VLLLGFCWTSPIGLLRAGLADSCDVVHDVPRLPVHIQCCVLTYGMLQSSSVENKNSMSQPTQNTLCVVQVLTGQLFPALLCLAQCGIPGGGAVINLNLQDVVFGQKALAGSIVGGRADMQVCTCYCLLMLGMLGGRYSMCQLAALPGMRDCKLSERCLLVLVLALGSSLAHCATVDMRHLLCLIRCCSCCCRLIANHCCCCRRLRAGWRRRRCLSSVLTRASSQWWRS
jgi:hypothetical protein